MVNWQLIRTVFLDMDGTLLDLHFDNYFWLHHVPQRYAEKYGMSLPESKDHLKIRYDSVANTMQWYCVDYWTKELGLNIAELKAEVSHLIALRTEAKGFLVHLRTLNKRVVLLTNAHPSSLDLKMQRTGLASHFCRMISAHTIGVPKEHPDFWEKLQTIENFDAHHTLLIDDSHAVLQAADVYGISHLLGIYQPDSKLPPKDPENFRLLKRFAELMPPDGKRSGIAQLALRNRCRHRE